MASHDVNLAERTGSLVESHKGYDPRIVFFYPLLALLLLILCGGLVYRQLIQTDDYSEQERTQNQRRVLVPGPRGDIYDRNGNLLVGNKPRFAAVLYLDELRAELRREHLRIHNNFLAAGASRKDFTYAQIEDLARVSVAQHYLDQANKILHRDDKVEPDLLKKHINSDLLLPYPLIDNLRADEYARLIEHLPVKSPMRVVTTNSRYYPYESAAAHTLGYVRSFESEADEDFPGQDLKTSTMKGTIGKDGIEKQFDDTLQGDSGYSIIRVDPAGFKVASPDLPHQLPKQGKDLTVSLDIDLQQAAEEAISPKDKPDLAQTGAAVAIDVNTGEVLVLASKPDYDLNKFSPRATKEFVDDMTERGAWNNLAIMGTYPAGSTFKILTTIAALRRNVLTPGEPIVDCEGWWTLPGTRTQKPCENGHSRHGQILLRDAISQSCDIYFYKVGELVTPDGMADEARRFHLDRRTGIELPGEGHGTIPAPQWKERTQHEKWFPGDTANMAIGQGFVLVTPLEMACFAASVARDEISTQPTLLHEPNRPRQHTESIGLTPAQRRVLLDGMFGCTQPPSGTARAITEVESYRVPGVRIAGKTGTAQKRVSGGKNINLAWFICFAPVENPEIAIAVMIEGDTPGEEFQGGRHAAPVAARILQKYFEEKSRPTKPLFTPPIKG